MAIEDAVRRTCLALPEVTERRLDRDPDPAEMAEICTDAYRAVAPKSLLTRLDPTPGR
jgi:hypothetical protein